MGGFFGQMLLNRRPLLPPCLPRLALPESLAGNRCASSAGHHCGWALSWAPRALQRAYSLPAPTASRCPGARLVTEGGPTGRCRHPLSNRCCIFSLRVAIALGSVLPPGLLLLFVVVLGKQGAGGVRPDLRSIPSYRLTGLPPRDHSPPAVGWMCAASLSSSLNQPWTAGRWRC